jgi:hypothetical protein
MSVWTKAEIAAIRVEIEQRAQELSFSLWRSRGGQTEADKAKKILGKVAPEEVDLLVKFGLHVLSIARRLEKL